MNGRRRSLLAVLGLLAVGTLAGRPAAADVLDDLRQKLYERRQEVRAIEERVTKHQEEVGEKRAEARTLQGQITVIDGSVRALTLAIDKTVAEIAEVEAELDAIREEIAIVARNMDRQKALLAEYLRTLQTLDADSVVEQFFKYPSLSSAVAEIRAVYRAEQQGQETLNRIRGLRTALEEREESFTDLSRELEGLQARQEGQKQTLEDQKEAKERLLTITKEQETEFQKLLGAAIEEQKRANAEIARLDREIRTELERQGITKLGGVGVFDFPIDPLFGVSCGFHCPDYPYRNLIGPHAGIDLPTHMGTTIRAPADGYVARVSIAGGPGYSYILLIHGDDLSTVYGHIASASVGEGKFVTRGQPIGATGGAPGTPGAGLSTGPHLHFEVRKDGLPVDPLPYLP